MNVVYGMTRNLYDKIVPSITSLLGHNDAKIFILAEDDKVPGLPCECEIINVADQTVFPKTGVNYLSLYTYMVLMRVCYPSLLPVDKVISIDVDTVILDSLMPIWEKDITGKWFAAVPESTSEWRPYGGIYFNVGVCVFNLKQMREDGIESILINRLNTMKLDYKEQDALNYYGLLHNKIATIPHRFNESFATGYTIDPAVVHYAGYPDWWTNQFMPRREYLEQYPPFKNLK